MFDFLVRKSKTPRTEIATDARKLREIRDELNRSVSGFVAGTNDWGPITARIGNLFDAELTSLYLVDQQDASEIVLETQTPLLTFAGQSLRHKIASVKGLGITSHAATVGHCFALDATELVSSPFLSRNSKPFLPSGLCYSVLFSPILDRKERLIGLLRVNNKQISQPSLRTAFNSDDIAIIEYLSADIAGIIENSRSYRLLRSPFESVAVANTTSAAVRAILENGKQLLRADYSKLALWNRKDRALKVAGIAHSAGEIDGTTNERVSHDSSIFRLWMSHQQAANLSAGASEDVVVSSLDTEAENGELCDPGSKFSISTILIVHRQPIGVLHLESKSTPFDFADLQILREYARNIAIAVQARNHEILSESSEFSLGEEGELYCSIVSDIPYVMWRKDLEGRLIWVNDHFTRTVGRTKQDILGKTDFDLFPDELAERFKFGDKVALDNGFFQDFEEPFVSEKLRQQTIHVVKTAVRDILGTVVGTQGMFSWDIDLFRSLFNQTPIAVVNLDSAGCVLNANNTAKEMFGLEDSKLRGSEFWKLASEQDVEVVKKLVNDQIHSSSPEKATFSQINYRGQTGEYAPARVWIRRIDLGFEETANQINDEYCNRKFGLVCALREIRAGEEIEEHLRDPSPRYLVNIQHLELPVFCLDEGLRLTFANDTYLERDGLEWEKVRGKTGVEIYGERGKLYHLDSQQVLDSGTVLDRVELHVGADGNEKVVHVLKFPVRDSRKRIVGIQCVFWDSDKEEFAINGLRSAFTNALQGLTKENEDVVTMLTHQLRTPAWLAYSRADRLVRSLDPHDKLFRGQATDAVRRLASIRGLVRKTRGVAWNIDMLSRLVQGGQLELKEPREIRPRQLDKTAGEYGRDILMEYRMRIAQLQRHSASLKGESEPMVPEFTNTVDELKSNREIIGNPDWIDQCIECLIQNAFKYSNPNSTIETQTEIKYDYVTLHVFNKPLIGFEMDQEACKACRLKNWRSDLARDLDADGTGLGLFLVEKIMEAHGGDLIVKETTEHGINEFAIRFPLVSPSSYFTKTV